jgi:hypothetical protein
MTTLPVSHLPVIHTANTHTMPLHLFKEGIMFPNTKNFHTNWDISLNSSPYLSFDFLDKVNHQPVKGKAIPLQSLTGPKVSSKLKLPHFKTIGT